MYAKPRQGCHIIKPPNMTYHPVKLYSRRDRLSGHIIMTLNRALTPDMTPHPDTDQPALLLGYTP